ncbi:MAG: NAD(P)H-dependent oxidoreductase [bacterium]
MRVLGVIGSLRDESYTARLVESVLEYAEAAGAEIRICDLRQIALPMYADHVDYSSDTAREQVREMVTWADGFVTGSPEYHGSMSGALKNFFDHFYHEFSGKCFALVAAAGGGSAVSCFTHMRATVQYCHGWSVPFQVGVAQADFPAEGGVPEKMKDRLGRLGRDLVVYGSLLKTQFDADLPLEGTASGFAGFHKRALLGK